MCSNHYLRALGIALGLATLSGCTTTTSQSLVVAASNYDARSREAIDAVETIERAALEQVEPTGASADADFVAAMLDPRLDLTGGDAANLIARRVHPYRADLRGAGGADSVWALQEMRCTHASFTAAFGRVRAAGLFGKKAVATRAPQFLDLLIAEQIALARIVAGPSRAEFKSRRSLLIAQMIAVRGSKQTDALKGEAMLALRTAWLAMEANEEALTLNAVTGLTKAAATGAELRDEIRAYGKFSLSDVSDSAKGLAAFIGSVRGADVSNIATRIDELRVKLESDELLAPAARLVLNAVDVPGAAIPGKPVLPAAAGPSRRSQTPCLDGLGRKGGTDGG